VGFLDRDKNLIAGAVFSNYTGFDVQISLGAVSPRWATKRNLKILAVLVFDVFGCTRITSIVPESLTRAREFNELSGFKLEGVQRQGFDGKEDAVFYGMLRDDCRWLS
jgi:hypothetical protein